MGWGVEKRREREKHILKEYPMLTVQQSILQVENQRHDLNEDRASQSWKQLRGHRRAGRLPLHWKENCRHAGAKTKDRTPAQSRPASVTQPPLKSTLPFLWQMCSF